MSIVPFSRQWVLLELLTGVWIEPSSRRGDAGVFKLALIEDFVDSLFHPLVDCGMTKKEHAKYVAFLR